MDVIDIVDYYIIDNVDNVLNLNVEVLGLRPAQIPRRRSIQANPDAILIDIDIDVARDGMIHPLTGGRRGVAEPIAINHLNIIDMKIKTEVNIVINIKNDDDKLIAQIKDGKFIIVGTPHSISLKAIHYTIAYNPNTDVFSAFNIESKCDNYYIKVVFTDSNTAQVHIFDSYTNLIFSIDRAVLKEAIDTTFSVEDKINQYINDNNLVAI